MASSFDLSTDAEAAVEYLLGREEIDAEQVGILGHSEGAWIAAMVAARNPDVAFVISMGGHAVQGDDLLMLQVEHLMETMDSSPGEIARGLEAARAEYDQIMAEDWEGIEARIRAVLPAQLEAMPEEQREALGDPEEIIAREMASIQNWLLYFLTNNPADDWEQVTVPILALFGELDVQVDLEQNRPPMEAALARAENEDVTVEVFPETNHLFQEAVTGSPEEYAELEPEFREGFLEAISSWLLERVEMGPGIEARH